MIHLNQKATSGTATLRIQEVTDPRKSTIRIHPCNTPHPWAGTD